MDKKALKNSYKHSKTKMGIYKIENRGNTWIGSAKNLDGIINSLKFQLDIGTHPNKKLQRAWDKFGGADFTTGIVDELEYDKKNPDKDYSDDLKALLEMWKEKLSCEGV